MTTGPDLPFHTKCNRVNNLRYEQDDTGSSSNGAGRGGASFLCAKGWLSFCVDNIPERKHYSTTSPMLGRGSVSLVRNKAESQESSSFHNPSRSGSLRTRGRRNQRSEGYPGSHVVASGKVAPVLGWSVLICTGRPVA